MPKLIGRLITKTDVNIGAMGLREHHARLSPDGEVSSAQTSRVADLLKTASPGQLRIVVVHQPVTVRMARTGITCRMEAMRRALLGT
jgi:hypothetical protein